jgi:hypothetical protein
MAGEAGDTGWKEALPEEIRTHTSLENIKSVGDLANSWVNAQKLIGKEKLPVPTGPEDKETWNTVYSRLGRPEKAEGYEINKDGIPSEVPVEEAFLTNFKTMAHTIGLLPNQIQGIFNWWVENEKGTITQLNETDLADKQKAETELRQDMGKAYEQNIRLASTVISKFGGNHVQDLLSSGFANDPKVIRLLASVGKAMSEDSDLLGEGGITTLTPSEAQIEIGKIQADPKHAYFNVENPEHQAAVDFMESLYKMVYPEGKK